MSEEVERNVRFEGCFFDDLGNVSRRSRSGIGGARAMATYIGNMVVNKESTLLSSRAAEIARVEA